jgi:hypothetical protein
MRDVSVVLGDTMDEASKKRLSTEYSFSPEYEEYRRYM